MPQHPVTKMKVVFDLPGSDAVTVLRDIQFRGADGDDLTMDLYRPPSAPAGARVPVVVVVGGYPDPGVQKILGCRFKEMEATIGWARLITASGMAAILSTNRQPAADVPRLLSHLRDHAAELGLDESRIGVWASSGNAPLGLSTLMKDARDAVKCAVLCYGYLLDLDGSTGVADAARTFGFVNPCTGKSVCDLRQDVPLFIARAGQDQMAGLNDGLDRFVARALAANLPLTLVNHAVGPHAFDLSHDSEMSREIIRQVLAFLRFHLMIH